MVRCAFALWLTLVAGCGVGGGGGGGGDGAGSVDASATGDGGSVAPDGGGEAACAEETGAFPAQWIRGGPDCDTEPAIQVHRYSEDTYILRQSLCTSFEAPFLYLLFGSERVLLEDTGAGGIDIADTVLGVIEERLAERGQESIELLVVNSHGHGDHVAGNSQFEGRRGVTVVGYSVEDQIAGFGLDAWPDDQAEIDLGGGRVVDVLPIPGHHTSHIALYDRRTALLLTGDTLYPGRLYISDFGAYQASIARLVAFMADRDVCWVLGTHIEMTQTPGEDYDFNVTDHPSEHALPLDLAHLLELRDGVDAMSGAPHIEAHDDFIIYPL